MSKICGLIKNELIKQYKKSSVKVMIIIILIASILLPVAIKYFNSRENLNYYNHDIKWMQQEIKNIDDSKKNKDIQKSIYDESIKMTEILEKHNIPWDDWRINKANEAATKAKEAIILSGIVEGFSGEELLADLYEFDGSMFTKYFDMTEEELQVEVNARIKESKDLYTSVENNDYLGYLEDSMKEFKIEIEDYKLKIDELKKNIEKDPNNKELTISLEEANLQLTIMEERFQATKYRYENKILYDNKDWKSNTIKDIANNIDQKGERLYSETEFTQYNSYQIANGYTYEDYKKDYEGRITSIEEAIALDWYSLNNNIPQVDFHEDIRSSVNSTYLIYVSICILLCIIIGGGIVSSEYSTGTVRLLIIRPVSRWKIIFSKLAAVFTIGYVVLVSAVIVNILTSGILYGFGGLAAKVISYSGGNIVEKNFIMSIIPKLLFSSISLIFMIALAFAISTIIKNTALAVGFTTFAYLGSSPATMVLSSLKMTWIEKTILPYMNLSTFISNPNYVSSFKQDYNMVLN
ncbi:MAG: ABC transporter permease subunit, partial [Peptostreptococcaceae bacterium]